MKTCQKCRENVQKQWENMTISREGLAIFLQGTPVYRCGCGEWELPSEVEELIASLLEQKKKHPDSPPTLYIPVKELLEDE